jgi:hypothetical protein
LPVDEFPVVAPVEALDEGVDAPYRSSPKKCLYVALRHLPSGEAVATLQAGLQMIRGKPYTARSGYTWAIDEQAAVRAQQTIVDLTAHLVELLGAAGDTGGVMRATSQAAHAIDDPLTQLPYRRVEASVAAATGDVSISASVLAHRRELQAYLDANDPFLDIDPAHDALLAQISQRATA